MKKPYQPYSFWDRPSFQYHFEKQLKSFAPNIEWIKRIVQEAIDSEDWIPEVDFNGCSFVEDRYHPCMACFIHDWLWHTGRGGAVADSIFYDLMLVDGSSSFKAWWRWAGVRCTWFTYYKWKYMAKKVKRAKTEGMHFFMMEKEKSRLNK